MSEETVIPGVTIHLPQLLQLAEAAASRTDPKTAEVLRALQRARGTITNGDGPTVSKTADDRIARLWDDVLAIKEAVSQGTLLPEQTAQRLESSARAVERGVAVITEKAADFQRAQDGATRTWGESVRALKQETAVLSEWQAWWTRHVAVFAFLAALLFALQAAVVLRAYSLGRGHARGSRADPREPGQGARWEGRQAMKRLHGIGKSKLRECSVASRPSAIDPTTTAALTRPAPSRGVALADAVEVPILGTENRGRPIRGKTGLRRVSVVSEPAGGLWNRAFRVRWNTRSSGTPRHWASGFPEFERRVLRPLNPERDSRS